MPEIENDILPDYLCLKCHRKLDAASDPYNKERRPKPGDISICLYCGNLAAFSGDGFMIRPLTDQEEADVSRDNRIMTARAAVLAVAEAEGWLKENAEKRIQ